MCVQFRAVLIVSQPKFITIPTTSSHKFQTMPSVSQSRALPVIPQNKLRRPPAACGAKPRAAATSSRTSGRWRKPSGGSISPWRLCCSCARPSGANTTTAEAAVKQGTENDAPCYYISLVYFVRHKGLTANVHFFHLYIHFFHFLGKTFHNI